MNAKRAPEAETTPAGIDDSSHQITFDPAEVAALCQFFEILDDWDQKERGRSLLAEESNSKR